MFNLAATYSLARTSRGFASPAGVEINSIHEAAEFLVAADDFFCFLMQVMEFSSDIGQEIFSKKALRKVLWVFFWLKKYGKKHSREKENETKKEKGKEEKEEKECGEREGGEG